MSRLSIATLGLLACLAYAAGNACAQTATPIATATPSPTPAVPTPTPDPLCASNVDGTTVTLDRDVSGCRRVGIRVRGAGVLDCAGHTIAAAGGTYGVLLDAASGAEVRNCTLTGFDRGIRIAGGSGNRVIGNTVRASDHYGIELAGATTGNRLEGNTVEDSGDEGIHVGSSSNDNEIVANTVRRSAAENLYLLSCSGNLASGNVLEDSGAAAIFVKHADGNRFAGNVARAGMIQIRGDASGNEFTDNQLQDNGYQLEAYQEVDGSWTYPHDNVFTGGSIRDASICFRFLGAYDNRASGTSISRCTPAVALPSGGRESTGNVVELCGDGVLHAGETCDAGNVNGTATSCCSTSCTATTGNVCRAAASECDVPEVCDGVTGACPANAFAPSGTACSPDAKPCSADACDANGRCAHPPGNAGVVCRASAGVCDVAEVCNGTSTSCPSDRFAGSETTCRASVDACDVAETCAGTGSACPADAYAAAGTRCRASAGPCDVAERCTGTSTACPVDAFVSAGTTCRASAGVCDVAEACTGSSAACPQDRYQSAGTVCRPSTGPCDRADTCSGGAATCRADAFVRDGASCSDGNACTTADACAAGKCVGSAVTCPAPSNACQQAGVCDPASGSCSYPAVTCATCDACDPASGCVTRPRSDCADAPPGGARLVIVNQRDDALDRIDWLWTSSAGSTRTSFGDPTAGADYGLCVYSEAKVPTRLLLRADAPGGTTCGGAPCWTRTADGFEYADASALSDGVAMVALSASDAGAGSLSFSAEGAVLATPRLPLATPILVQLQSPDGACWQARYSTLPTNRRRKARGASD